MNEIERARIIHDDQGDSYQNRKGIGTNLGAPMSASGHARRFDQCARKVRYSSNRYRSGKPLKPTRRARKRLMRCNMIPQV